MTPKKNSGPRCFNQLVRPKISFPTWSLPPGQGDCATCKPCARNKYCIGFVPAPKLFTFDLEDEDEEDADD